MLATLVCLIGLTLAGQDGPSVSATVRAPESGGAVVATREPGRADPSAVSSTPLDDEVEDFPDEPEGDDEEDPGEAMGTKGNHQGTAFIAPFAVLSIDAAPPSPALLAPPARARGSSLSLLCRLRF